MKEKQNTKPGNGDANDVLICALCGSKNVETSEQDHTFPYGVGDEKVELCAQVPVRTCSDCGFSFRDHVADAICHDAVCRHLGVMTPGQIRALRELYQLTQAEFSELTKLGEATLSRWERGVVVQNQAYDNYLYLLGHKENVERLRNRPADNLEQTAVSSRIKQDTRCTNTLKRVLSPAYPSFARACA